MDNGTDHNIRAVVFDLDGVLANTEDLYEIACETLLRRRGRTYDQPLREQMMGRPAAVAIKILIETHGFTEPESVFMDECQELMQQLLTTRLAPMPGVCELLNRIEAAGLPAAVATSAIREYEAFVLTGLGIRHRFQFVLTADDIRHGKPDPEIYLLASQRLGIEPRQMMVIEDSTNGCKAALAAGAFTVAVPNRHTAMHDFTGTQLVADTLADPRIVAAFAPA